MTKSPRSSSSSATLLRASKARISSPAMNESDRYTGSARLNPPAPRLFTYTIPIDDGAAPNPFRGMCSLAICKPGIRSTARKGDWVAGLGSSNAHSGDLSGRLVYAMRVEEVMSLSAGGRSTACAATGSPTRYFGAWRTSWTPARRRGTGLPPTPAWSARSARSPGLRLRPLHSLRLLSSRGLRIRHTMSRNLRRSV